MGSDDAAWRAVDDEQVSRSVGRALLAWNLRRIRTRRGISQERLADEAGVDRKYVGVLERKENAASVDILDRLARALEVELVEFFKRPPAGEAPPAPLAADRRRA